VIPEDATTVSVFRDGDQWCAVFTESFENIQESPCGFGYTKLEAIAALLEEAD
jgi:hypothetical protein